MQKDAACVLSDSGTVTEESSLLGFPAVTLRQAHERPEGMDSGVLIMSGLKAERVLQAVDIVMAHSKESNARSIVDDYEGTGVSQKVLKIVMSYMDYVQRNVWKRYDV